MAVTPTEVKALSLSGAFSLLSDPQIQPFIDLAGEFVDVTTWDKKKAGYADTGIAQLAAHFLQLELAGGGVGSAGPVTAEAAGGLSRSYEGAGGDALLHERHLNTTRYGRTFILLRKNLALGPVAGDTTLGHLHRLGTETSG